MPTLAMTALAAMGGAAMEHETRAGNGPHVTGSLGNPPKQGRCSVGVLAFCTPRLGNIACGKDVARE